jgi:hypothetical protein
LEEKMILIDDPVLAQIMLHGSHPGVPKSVCAGAYWKASLLLASRGWSTTGKFTAVAKLRNGRFAAPIDRRWAVTFAWDYDINRAFHLRLKRVT